MYSININYYYISMVIIYHIISSRFALSIYKWNLA
nr:MAG TPA: hypothetical protein [Bacteriophage sp.]